MEINMKKKCFRQGFVTERTESSFVTKPSDLRAIKLHFAVENVHIHRFYIAFLRGNKIGGSESHSARNIEIISA